MITWYSGVCSPLVSAPQHVRWDKDHHRDEIMRQTPDMIFWINFLVFRPHTDLTTQAIWTWVSSQWQKPCWGWQQTNPIGSWQLGDCSNHLASLLLFLTTSQNFEKLVCQINTKAIGEVPGWFGRWKMFQSSLINCHRREKKERKKENVAVSCVGGSSQS